LTVGPLVAFAAAAALLFSGAGCLVTKTTYDMKSNEADSLREALASVNRENATLSRQAAADRETIAALAAQIREKDESLNRISEETAAARQIYEGSQLTREQFINELLEREKATGKRFQELSARAEGYEQELERMKKERDILSGRVERLQEERLEAERQRDERLAGLSEELRRLSPEIAVYPMGPALRIVVPEKLVLGERGGKLTKLGSALMAQVAAAVAEIPSASLVVVTGGKTSAEALREAAVKGKIPEGRLFSQVRAKERQTELLLIAP